MLFQCFLVVLAYCMLYKVPFVYGFFYVMAFFCRIAKKACYPFSEVI